MPSAHLHLMVRATIANPPGPDKVEYVNQFMTDLVGHVRMKILAPARSLWCDEPGNEGITADVLLTTSNSVVHIWNDTGLFEFDLYSCAPYTPEEVIEFIKSRFEVETIVYKFIDRETGLIDLSKDTKWQKLLNGAKKVLSVIKSLASNLTLLALMLKKK